MPIRRQFPARAIEAASLNTVEPAYFRALTRLLAAHGLAERLSAQGYDRLLQSIENPALRPIVEKTAAGERRHAIMIYQALAEISVDERVADRMLIATRRKPCFEALHYFAGHSQGEIDLLMASLSLETAGQIMVGVNYSESSYAPYCRIAEVIVEDEAEHCALGNEQLGEAIECFGAEAVMAALRRWLPRTVNLFGPPGSGFTYDCLRFGLKNQDNGDLAILYLAVLERRLNQHGLSLPNLTSNYPRTIEP